MTISINQVKEMLSWGDLNTFKRLVKVLGITDFGTLFLDCIPADVIEIYIKKITDKLTIILPEAVVPVQESLSTLLLTKRRQDKREEELKKEATLLKELILSNNIEACVEIAKLLGVFIPEDRDNISDMYQWFFSINTAIYDDFRWSSEYEIIDPLLSKIGQIRKDLFDKWKQEGRAIDPNLVY